MFMFALSTVEPKNIKEAMDDHVWIDTMQEELHQFDILKVWELVDKPFGKLDKCDSIGTPMATSPKLDADLSGTPVDKAKYRSMIESLMYLTSSRLDPVHATCYCTRYQVRPTKKYLNEVKRIIWYLKKTIHMGLWYLKDSGFELTTFSDTDHVGCLDTCKSTSGGI
ncbi:hypothetical protein Tco_0768031 [Tanacetum coccineum]